jgi:deoxyxylulose-5-phosphate synthase
MAYDICKKLNVNLVYYTTIRPFDRNAIKKLKIKTKKVLIIEPFYTGSVTEEVIKCYNNSKIQIENISIPYKFLTNYGVKKEHDKKLGFTKNNLEIKLKKLMKNKI